MNVRRYDLAVLAEDLGKTLPAITSLHIFGSRRYKTLSRRSDVDILVCAKAHVPPADLRTFTAENCPALDLFLVHNGSAMSCQNESLVEAITFEALAKRLDAVAFWQREGGAIRSADIDWAVEVFDGVPFGPSGALQSIGSTAERWLPSFKDFLERVEQDGFPRQPYLGTSALDIASFLIAMTRRAVSYSSDLNPKGTLKVSLRSEYDFQSLFYLCVKPWIPTLGREETTVTFAGAAKKADFHVCGTRIVVELKYVKNTDTLNKVEKSLDGLATFYKENANVSVIVFLVLVERTFELDDARFEGRFSHAQDGRRVITAVIRNVI